MPLDVIDSSLVLSQLLLLLAVVVAEVACVEHVVLQRVEMVSQRFDVMRADEPLFVVLVWQGVLDVLQVVVGRQIELITRRDVVMHKLCAILNHTKPLVGIVLLARLDVNKVLLNVVLRGLELLLLFQLFLQLFIFAVHA